MAIGTQPLKVPRTTNVEWVQEVGDLATVKFWQRLRNFEMERVRMFAYGPETREEGTQTKLSEILGESRGGRPVRNRLSVDH